MHRQTLYRAAAVVLLLGTPAVHGQEPAPVRIKAAMLAEGGPLRLVFAWRYHPGDDPRWADPALDDSGWELAEPSQRAGWFRRHLRIEPALQGKPLVIRVETPGATTVFLDGSRLLDATAPGPGRRAGVWKEAVFSSRPDHVLAVRHTGAPGFLLSIEPTDAAPLQFAAERRQGMRQGMVDTALTAVPAFLAAFLALFHLALYLFYRKSRENLFYALAVAASAALLALGLVRATSEDERALISRLFISGVLAGIFFGLLTYYSVRTRVFPRTWIAFAAAGMALILLAFLHPDPPFRWIWSVYFALMMLEVIRVEVTGETVAREGIRILLGGFLILGLILVLQILIDFGVVQPIAQVGSVWVFGMFALEVAMSLFLARSFARTSLMEAEHARKAAEIEAARTLQLSMLPATLPAVEGLETAAAMIPASEVGGDYYDFRVTPDGSLVVAFGDAAGHGVAAGILVTAVKALFSTLGGGESLSAVLAECDRVLRAMQARPLHMCLALARLTPGSIAVCSAAMPPVLIHRAATGEVEELGTGGRPIGSRLTGAWTEHRAPLDPGDTLLFASDGLAEQLDPDGNPFSYERLAAELRASASLTPGELVESLLARIAAWRGEREQGDDVTLVVIRATG